MYKTYNRIHVNTLLLVMTFVGLYFSLYVLPFVHHPFQKKSENQTVSKEILLNHPAL